ncbi:hypothetical protein Taro_049252, partial [Colocasia esculenta]|nr:hypothetical protein [Colocasia esculenta]
KSYATRITREDQTTTSHAKLPALSPSKRTSFAHHRRRHPHYQPSPSSSVLFPLSIPCHYLLLLPRRARPPSIDQLYVRPPWQLLRSSSLLHAHVEAPSALSCCMLIAETAPSVGDKLLRAPPAMDTASTHGRDHLLDHAPRDQFATGGAGAPPSKLAPVDFGDVFGGPPRRRISGNADAFGAVGVGRVAGGVLEEQYGQSSRRWSASVAEKPVFGGVGVGSPTHRRHLEDDFFSDIFRGNRDLFPPFTTASRVLSPTLPRQPTGDMFGGVSAVPSHLSYSSRLAKSFDYSSFRAPPSFPVCQHEEIAPVAFSVPSSPSVCAPARGARQTDKQLKKASAGSKAYGGSGHFHFSIYKWASKGVTLIMPSSFTGRTKSGSRLGAVSSQVWHREDLPLDNEDMFQGIHCLQNLSEVEDKSPFKDLASSRNGHTGSSNEVTEITLPAAADMKSDASGSHARDSRGFLEEEEKLRLKNLHEQINENSEGEGDEVITRQTRKKGGLASEVKAVMKHGEGTAEVKQKNRKNTISDCAETASQERHTAPKILEDKVLPARAKLGRVKEHIKNFNQEATEKTSDPVGTQTRRPKVKERVEERASAHIANSEQQDNGNCVEALSIPLGAGQSMKKEHKATMKGLGVEKVDGSYPERSGASVPLSDSTPESLDASFCNMEEVHYENIEECLGLHVEELSQDHNEVTETDLHQEENKTKIQEYKSGRRVRKETFGHYSRRCNMFCGLDVGGNLFPLLISLKEHLLGGHIKKLYYVYTLISYSKRCAEHVGDRIHAKLGGCNGMPF